MIVMVILTFNASDLSCQEFKMSSDGKLITSVDQVIGGLINGKVCISDIYYPDKKFECLMSLGKPQKIEESHTVVGDDYKFYFEGFNLYFSNVSDAQMKLSLVEFYSESSSFLLLKGSKDKISTKKEVKEQFTKSNIDQFDLDKRGNTTIKFYDHEGSSMTYERENGIIKKIKIYFL